MGAPDSVIDLAAFSQTPEAAVHSSSSLGLLLLRPRASPPRARLGPLLPVACFKIGKEPKLTLGVLFSLQSWHRFLGQLRVRPLHLNKRDESEHYIQGKDYELLLFPSIYLAHIAHTFLVFRNIFRPTAAPSSQLVLELLPIHRHAS